jgi:putative peptidoglycan lipid II flippase
MSIIRSAAKVGGFTSISRVLGFIRDQLIAFTLGTGYVADAFFVAQRFPNLFRTLFAEGAFNSAFVPIFAGKVETEGLPAARAMAQDVYAVMLAWMLFFCTICIIFMPWLIALFTIDFTHFLPSGMASYFALGSSAQPAGSPQKTALLVSFTQICFPYLLFMTLTALQGGALNSLNRFAAAAAAPILLNIVLILSNAVVWFIGSGKSELTGYIFAAGVTLSGLAQYALLAIACRRANLIFLPKLPRLTDDVKNVIKRSVPGIISGGVMQINLLIATFLAWHIPHANSYLYYADRLYQLPLGIIGVAIGVVLLPTLSRTLRAGDFRGALDAKNRALEFSLFLTLPSTAALIVIAGPILRTVFQHGAFQASDTAAVAPTVAAFALGLPAYSLSKVFQPGFYARGDTRTPMRFALISVVVNIVGSITFSHFLGHIGIALATSLAAWINALQLYFRLRSLDHFGFDEDSRFKLPRMVLSTLVMAAVLFDLNLFLGANFTNGASVFSSLWGLGALVGAGIVSYFAASELSGAWTFSELKAALKRN